MIAGYADVMPNAATEPFDPDWEGLARYETAGWLRVFTARSGATLAGYNMLTIAPNLFCRTMLRAHGISFWLHPAYRAGWAGVRLIRRAEQGLRKEGTMTVQYTLQYKFQAERGGVARLMEYCGYQPIGPVYEKVL